ncbi:MULTISPECIES: flagellar basal-body MS-ring/collar protein FliF [Clostridium]|uniref:Flagellar M-ring protein n=1 Tax=Clostridium cibarium TaxID=2762247 RepID=A0ABR8PNU4_9CLOT|nr:MULTISPECIES: flagellar basal-body MS-ring/collar protein FliF [Clostridium]MBD7909845.1 flagellar M-ring protein FliF [Clostridium cibarium]
MKKLSEMLKKLWTKFKSFSKKVRIAIIVAIVATIVALVSMVVVSSANKYQVLFSNLDSQDAKMVKEKLGKDKVEMKVDGDSILVPKDKVDELRLELAGDLTGGSKGYELMDKSSSFGMTDEEFNIKKIRMIQGELEKSIKSLDPVESAKVNITPAEDSVFVKDKQPGKAAVVLKLKPGEKITEDQVKSIVAMVSMSAENIPKENVEVIDNNMNLLTKNIGKDDGTTVSSETLTKQRDLEAADADKYSKAIVGLLEPVLGKGKVSANVNVDLDFDSKKKTIKTIDPNKVIVSQQTSKETNSSGDGTTSQSPVDNNMSNTIQNNNNKSNSSKESQTTNYDSGKSETETISSPGEVKRLTASVFVDGAIDDATKADLEKAVGDAIGIDANRGDQLSLVGMNFDTAQKDQAKAQVDAFNAELAANQRNKYIIAGVIAAAVIIGLIVFIVIRRRKNKAEEIVEDEDNRSLDVVIDDQLPVEDTTEYTPIQFEVPNKQAHIENEIKNYAKEKPDQVLETIKSWLSENER